MEGSSSSYCLPHKILLVILLLTTSVNLIYALEKTSAQFIRTSCSVTLYPSLCFSSLSARASEIQTSLKLLAQTALSVTLDITRSTSSTMVKLSQMHGMIPQEVAAMKDCLEVLSDAVDELEKSLGEMTRQGSKDFRLMINDVQTWVSAALTNEDTCSEGFANDRKLRSVVRGKITNIAHLTSNALALINKYASLQG